MKNIYDLLPEKISDEAAYHLVSFFINITEELEFIYFAQMRRYVGDSKPVKTIERSQKF